MKLIHKKGLILSVLFIPVFAAANILVPINPVLAANTQFFKADNIIDDIVFTNNNSMTASQIQDFLNSKNSTCLKNFKTLSLVDDNGDGQVQDTTTEPYGRSANMSAAEVIKAASDIYKINPQVILATLEKEQGLVTRADCPDWRYNTALGYGCPDTAPCSQAAYGFTRQIDYGVFHFRGFFDDTLTTVPYGVGNYRVSYNPSSSCGSSIVNIKNRATASLYSYTPYQPNAATLAAAPGQVVDCGAYGNINFWRYFTDWFGSTQVAGKWLRQTPDGQVWLVVDGTMPDGSYAKKRFRLANWDTYLAYFLQYEPVVPVSNEYITQFTDDGTLTTRTIGKSYSQIQFANNGDRYYIPDTATCTAWGFDCLNTNQTKTIPGTEFLERLTGKAKALPPVMAYQNTVYKLMNGNKLPIIDGQTFSDLGYSWDNVLYDTQTINASQAVGALQISHQLPIQFNTSSPVVVSSTNASQYYKVPSYDVFSAWGMQSYAVLNPVASTYTTTPPPVSSPDISIWATDDAGHKYILDQGRKIDVSSSTDMPSAVWQNLGKDLLTRLPTTAYNNYVQIKETGAVYNIDSGQKRSVPNWETFVALKLSIPQLLSISSYTASQIPDGAYKLSDGASFEYSSGIWIVNGTSKYHLPSWEYYGYFNIDPSKRIIGQPNLGTAYTGTTELSVLVKDSSGSKYVMQNGTRLLIDSATQAAWGLPDGSFVSISSDILSKLPVVGALKNFVYGSGGLYYGSGGQKHHIDSYQSYQNLGGNTGNTPTVANDFFNAAPSGPSIP